MRRSMLPVVGALPEQIAGKHILIAAARLASSEQPW